MVSRRSCVISATPASQAAADGSKRPKLGHEEIVLDQGATQRLGMGRDAVLERLDAAVGGRPFVQAGDHRAWRVVDVGGDGPNRIDRERVRFRVEETDVDVGPGAGPAMGVRPAEHDGRDPGHRREPRRERPHQLALRRRERRRDHASSVLAIVWSCMFDVPS
jgi:hypothetical protein